MATEAQKAEISQIYVGYFNRAPDPAGLQYWVTQLSNGMPLGEIADYFANEQETLDLYPYLREPALNSVDDFINQIYTNLFNRPADAAGLAFWKGQLDSGAVSEGEFIAAIANGATGEGRLVLDNKVAVGVHFATELSQNNVVWNDTALDAAYQALSGVTLDPDSVIAANAATDSFVATGAWPGTVGELYTLTTGLDQIPGTAGNDTVQGIVGTGATLNTFDDINGAAGQNTLNLVVRGPDARLANFVDIENIQTVNLVSDAGEAAYSTTTTVYGLNGNGTVTANAAARAIDASYFGGQLETLWQVDAANTVIGLKNGQTAGFKGDIESTANTIAGVAPGPLRAEFVGTEASVALDGLPLYGAQQRINLEVNGSKVETLTIAGSVGPDAEGGIRLDTAVTDAQNGVPAVLASNALSNLTTINLELSSDGEITLGRGALGVIAGVETIDASGSTGDLEIDFATISTSLHIPGVDAAAPVAALALEDVSFGSGNDLSNIVLGSLTATNVSVDLGAGNDAFAVALGYEVAGVGVYGSASNLAITTGIGRDVLAFGELDLVAREVDGQAAIPFFPAQYSGNVQLNTRGDGFVGSVTVTDFDSALDTVQIAGFSGFTAQTLINSAISGADSLFDAVTAVADVVSNAGFGTTNITQFAQFEFEGNTYIYGDVNVGAADLSGDLLIGFTGVVDLNANNVTIFA